VGQHDILVSFAALDAKTSTLTGWVSDESCGAAHTETGKESCVAKCLRGGASVGHPEWLPQRMALVRDDGKTTWIVENPAALITRAGQHVGVDVTSSKHANSSTAGTVGGVAPFGFRLVDPNDIDRAITDVECAGGRLLRRGEFAPRLPYAYVADPDGYEIEMIS
jgi:catechol 2,3-dioxygenase-like lactoylglutathione lyase family enzyme